MRRRWWRWILGALAVVVIAGVLAPSVVDEPLRRRVEARMNAALEGYKVSIRELDFHPLDLSVDVVDWVVTQEANPDPPVAYVPRLHASVQWLELARGHLVADFRFERPELYIDVRHARQEAQDETPVDERGWQEAALAIYPLKINLIRVLGGKVTYLERGPLGPVYLWDLDFRAANIRNVRSRDHEYPSEVHLSAKVQDSATLRVDGNADFLAVPHPGIRVAMDLDGLKLAALEPIVRHYDVALRSGTLAMAGNVEYAPKTKKVDLAHVVVDRADVRYVKRRAAQPTLGEKAAQTAAEVTKDPSIVIRAAEVKIDRSRLGYTNETTSPAYELFVADCNLNVRNFTNLRTPDAAGTGSAEASGKFMDSGDTAAHATFRPHERGADFDLQLAIENTDVTTLNDLWRAYGKFDFERGLFSLYSEMSVANGRVDGYVKPIFRDLDVLQAKNDKGVGQKIYEGIVGSVANILKNQPRDQVATETRLSGPLENPQASPLQIFGGLVQNAFFKAILPGLEQWRGRAR